MRTLLAFIICLFFHSTAYADYAIEWPKTNFKKSSIDLKKIASGGTSRDGIPAIDKPKFSAIDTIKDIRNHEPVITVEVGSDVRAYPLRYLMFHEIVNDVVGDLPLTITYCPLCNTSLVFKRTIGDRTLDFGASGKLRMSNLIMYDRQTESWWQQANGQAIVGEYNRTHLEQYPSRLESFEKFKERHPAGKVLIAEDPLLRPYGYNPYQKYDSLKWPYFYKGEYKGPPDPMMRVVAVDNEAWSFELLQQKGKIEHEGIVITWSAGQSSAVDTPNMFDGKDVGNITVIKDGKDIAHDIPFAFVFKAFKPNGKIYVK